MKLLILLIFSSVLHAQPNTLMTNGNGVGNGGDVVLCKDSIELLDFVEAKMKGDKLSLSDSTEYKTQVKKVIDRLKSLDEKLFKQYSKVLLNIHERINFIPNASFRDVPDSLEIAIPKDCRVEQVAIQRVEKNRNIISISQDLWAKMSSSSKAGLVLHEIIYEHFVLMGEKNSIKVRAFNAFLNSERAEKFDRKQFVQYCRDMGIKLY